MPIPGGIYVSSLLGLTASRRNTYHQQSRERRRI